MIPNQYLPNLHGLRFMAALMVFIHHTEQLKSIFQIADISSYGFIELFGKLGVVLFFVLSGFLITYLLLSEEVLHGRINIRKFYFRRILRIWPLYFFIIILSLFVFPYINILYIPGNSIDSTHADLSLKLSLFVLVLPNLVLSIFGPVPFASQTWSIGSEEQYYLTWPLFLCIIKRHRILLLSIVIVFYLFLLLFIHSTHFRFFPGSAVVAAFISTLNFDSMAIGSLFAFLSFKKNRFNQFLYNKFFFLSVLAFLTLLIALGYYFPFFNKTFYALLFAIVVLNFAKGNVLYLENKFFRYFGEISYGLYMYHTIGIVLAINILEYSGYNDSFLIYGLSLLFTFLFSSISYSYFEAPFLGLKKKYAILKK